MSNIQRLEGARSILHEGKLDYSAFLAIVNEDSIMHYQGAGLPFCGVFSGRAGFIEFFDKLFTIRNRVVSDERLRFFAYETAEGHVVSGGTNLIKNLKTGFACEMEWLSFCTFSPDGMILKLSTFSDSTAFLRAMQGGDKS
ncbi:MAG TPA: hypothetical protein PKX47_07345 [Smithellaceae bacterium]|nr:hypothetical protein [Smithellaceae bacterium]HQP26072.1 hypothetical protein [Smithellaceae bacterium]